VSVAGDRSRVFWGWVAAGVVLVALASASLGFAFANRNYAEPVSTAGWTNYVPLDNSSIFSGANRCYDCVDPTPWYVVGGGLLFVALLSFWIAHRQQQPDDPTSAAR
jgi:hypothetical protein